MLLHGSLRTAQRSRSPVLVAAAPRGAVAGRVVLRRLRCSSSTATRKGFCGRAMNEENVTIPLPPALHAAVSRRAEPTTLHDSAKSTAVTSSGLDPRSMLGTLGGLTRLRNGIAFWARLNALICLGMTVLHEVTYRWFAHRTGDAPWASLTRSEEHTSELQSQSNLVCRLLLEKK